jgi:hypothetical protein
MFFYAMNNSTLTLSFTDLDSIFSGYGSRSGRAKRPGYIFGFTHLENTFYRRSGFVQFDSQTQSKYITMRYL